MSALRLESTLRDLGVAEYIRRAGEVALARVLASSQTSDTEQLAPERLPRLGFLFESQGMKAFQRWVASRDEEALKEARSHFGAAFVCWRTLLSLPDASSTRISNHDVSQVGIQLIQDELGDETISAELNFAFRVGVTGLLGERSTETRLELERFALYPSVDPRSWNDLVSEFVFSAFILLVRKSRGWEDINLALSRIGELRRLQEGYEETYLEGQGSTPKQTVAAVELVGQYHLAQMITHTGEYLRDGIGSITQVNLRIDRHRERAIASFRTGKRPLLLHATDLLWAGCRELIQNAIWTHINSLGEDARRFAQLIADKERPRPVIELWPSQQKALQNNLLDPYRRAILIEMPTSAGKTLLAEFAIVQTRALNPNATIAYIVPTRALVNQVTRDLRENFRPLSMRVEQAVPAFELDPTEERLLKEAPDILVTTPEKLDLLIRRNHAATSELSLVIADEAHNIRESVRGARLELLLGTIKRDRAGARFLLLSPFLPEPQELVQWLGEERALPPISVNWKPGRRIVGAVNLSGRGSRRALTFETLPAADNTDVRPGLQILIGPNTGDNTLTNLTRSTVKSMLDRGSVLILCRGKGTAVTRARQIAEDLPELPPNQRLETVCRYLDAEIGQRSSLVKCLRHGVAYHHAGLSHEARWLIESLIRRGDVKVVCGTTTLAQGMNFPVTTVIVETLRKGDEALSYQDFWNIAGRAGRALMDTVGVVAFPAYSANKRQEYIEFLRDEAQAVSSQLAALIEQADEIAEQFDLETLRAWPQLSALLQFLAHAMRVSGNENVADEVEDLLRASLVYHQAKGRDDQAAQRLVSLCRSYLEQIRGETGLLTLADKTGFATPSVLNLLGKTRRTNQELVDATNWRPERLFSENLEPMRERVEVIAYLPEMQLGQSTGQPFNAERVAAILRDWVRGQTLSSLAEEYLISDETDPDKRVTEFSSYLFSELIGRASWGIGALENISLREADEEQWEEVGYVPSMIFFGVQRKEAVWLRMVGIPRVVADGLGRLWQRTWAQDPGTYDDIRNWINQLSDDEWEQALPRGATLTPQDMRYIWEEFTG